MKRIVLSLLILELFLFSVCQAKNVSLDNAAIVAEKFLAAKGFPQKKLVLHKNVRSGFAHAPSQSVVAPAYYVFSMSDEAGFVIVSGDDIAKPILGCSFEGTFEEDDLPPNMQEWLEDMEKQIMQARESGMQQSEETAQQWKAPTVGRATFKLQTALWHQRNPLNQLCPLDKGKRSVTGCVATAHGILMKYYGYPAKGRGTTKAYITGKKELSVAERNLDHPYNWDMILMEYKDGEYNQEQANAVAELLADIGAAIKADYASDETGATTGHKAIFAHFGFNPGNIKYKEDYSSTEWSSMLKRELNMQRPLLYGASHSEGGHAFILEGYTDQDYFYVNWGWGGNYNGAFSLDALRPGSTFYDGSQQAYFDCVPAEMLSGVAKVNDSEECPSLKAAISMAAIVGSPMSIKMVQDAQVYFETIDEEDDITLDLNGHRLDVIHSGIYNYGRLRIVDNKGTGKIIASTGNSGIFLNYGLLDIEGGEYFNKIARVDSTDYRRCVWSAEGSNTTIRNGKFTSPIQTLCFNGDATIENGVFETTGNSSVVSNYGTSGQTTIKDGTFTNTSQKPDGSDYRRCVWTAEGSKTMIKNGKFSSPNQALCFNGDATIENGVFESTGTNSVISNYNTSGELTILDGTFTNIGQQPDGSDYRRSVWTAVGTKTMIKNGKFFSPIQPLCLNGDATVENGFFEATGNSSVVANYNTSGQLIILGGTFNNTGLQPDGSDYRRSVWTTKESSTIISGGIFTCESGSQTLCFTGNAAISGGIIENKGNGISCASNADVTISNCMMSGNRILYAWEGAKLKCSGGLYSQPVAEDFLASGCYCNSNNDAATKLKYPFLVIDPTGIETVSQSEDMSGSTYYGINGMVLPDKRPGLIIERKKNGKTAKRYHR